MSGDGIFMWFWGEGTEPSAWNGPYVTPREATDYAVGHRRGGDYTLIEADRQAIDAHVFIASDVLAALLAANPACWPAGALPIATLAEETDLAAKLGDCLDRWLRKHHYDATTAIATIRTRDYFPSQRAMA